VEQKIVFRRDCATNVPDVKSTQGLQVKLISPIELHFELFFRFSLRSKQTLRMLDSLKFIMDKLEDKFLIKTYLLLFNLSQNKYACNIH